MLQGAVGHVRLVEQDGRTLVEKRMPDPVRHDTEVCALRALAGSGLPVPELVKVEPGSILMTLMPGERLDSMDADMRLDRLRSSGQLLRRLHDLTPPPGLPPAPDDALIVRRYRDARSRPSSAHTGSNSRPPRRGRRSMRPNSGSGSWRLGRRSIWSSSRQT